MSLVDWSGRHEDSRGRSEADETPQTRSVEEARRSPAGKRSAWNGNQQPSLTEPSKKETLHLKNR